MQTRHACVVGTRAPILLGILPISRSQHQDPPNGPLIEPLIMPLNSGHLGKIRGWLGGGSDNKRCFLVFVVSLVLIGDTCSSPKTPCAHIVGA